MLDGTAAALVRPIRLGAAAARDRIQDAAVPGGAGVGEGGAEAGAGAGHHPREPGQPPRSPAVQLLQPVE